VGRTAATGIDAQKRAQARQMGAVATIERCTAAVKQVMEATGGGAAAAIDFLGSPKTTQFGVDVLRKGGKLVMVGLLGRSSPDLDRAFPVQDDDNRRVVCRHP
jgi:threonine dehydrogenase-like Zn-dependent dehydrogenase